ncbi:AfsA-related hotdog domain-containing protein [Kitasatospora sp. SUK 42]|uniref:AfsA-related hotdog domain-containing protein n=1 Tax=Kitasatospora sp. SUK 42 TaxID=1588882 RepID=UPI0018CAA791|nr:AfsA-related hotdog domain-containing protein [Kitasatospora sp. SUK 42]MBV2154805.1 hypothetical protein [Kitasatospora sp. SUK 42]
MTTDLAPTAPQLPDTRLAFERTVARSLVHRSSVSEVFVTDVRPQSDTTVLTGAQLPLNHGYFSDHLQSPRLYDALLLLEAGRQAGIAGSHAHIGLKAGTTMIVDSFTLRLENLPALLIGADPGELTVETEYIGRRRRAGRWRKGTIEQSFHIGGVPVGRHAMDALFVNPHENEILRHAQRGTPAPLTSQFPDTEPAGHAAPHLVGRANPLNVVLADPAVTGRTATALVAPRYGNRSLFDHDYDHLPASVLVEAARQLALLAVGEHAGAEARSRTHLVGIDAAFARFAELDLPVHAELALSEAESGRTSAEVRFRHGAEEIASITVALAEVRELPDAPVVGSDTATSTTE